MSDIPTPAIVALVMVGAFIIVGIILWVADIMAGPCDCRSSYYGAPPAPETEAEKP